MAEAGVDRLASFTEETLWRVSGERIELKHDYRYDLMHKTKIERERESKIRREKYLACFTEFTPYLYSCPPYI